MFQDDRRKMASQHVFEVFSQTLAAQEALGLASSREATGLGGLLLLRRKT
jgi:hypothetical protein